MFFFGFFLLFFFILVLGLLFPPHRLTVGSLTNAIVFLGGLGGTGGRWRGSEERSGRPLIQLSTKRPPPPKTDGAQLPRLTSHTASSSGEAGTLSSVRRIAANFPDRGHRQRREACKRAAGVGSGVTRTKLFPLSKRVFRAIAQKCTFQTTNRDITKPKYGLFGKPE